MSSNILRKDVKEVACEEWGWVAERVVSLCNLDVTEVAVFGSGISAKTLGAVAGSEESSYINMMANEMSKVTIKSIYIDHHLVNSVKYSETTT